MTVHCCENFYFMKLFIYTDEEKVTDMVDTKLCKAMNQLDTISEKSIIKNDDTEVEDEENFTGYFVTLERCADSDSQCSDKI